jgi:hypothetical protein
MLKLKMFFVTALVTLTAVTGVAAAKNGGHRGGHRAGMIQKFDANGDGKLDNAERAKAREAMRAMHAQRKAQRLAQFDANKNGALDPAEKQAMHDQRATARFAQLDANQDDKLTLDEFKAGKRMGKRGHGRKQP